MKELKEKISELIGSYFDKKTENVDWRYDLSAEEKAKRIVQEAIKDVLYTLDDCNNEIDEHLEEFEEAYTDEPDQFWEDLRIDNYYRTRDLLS